MFFAVHKSLVKQCYLIDLLLLFSIVAGLYSGSCCAVGGEEDDVYTTIVASSLTGELLELSDLINKLPIKVMNNTLNGFLSSVLHALQIKEGPLTWRRIKLSNITQDGSVDTQFSLRMAKGIYQIETKKRWGISGFIPLNSLYSLIMSGKSPRITGTHMDLLSEIQVVHALSIKCVDKIQETMFPRITAQELAELQICVAAMFILKRSVRSLEASDITRSTHLNNIAIMLNSAYSAGRSNLMREILNDLYSSILTMNPEDIIHKAKHIFVRVHKDSMAVVLLPKQLVAAEDIENTQNSITVSFYNMSMFYDHYYKTHNILESKLEPNIEVCTGISDVCDKLREFNSPNKIQTAGKKSLFKRLLSNKSLKYGIRTICIAAAMSSIYFYPNQIMSYAKDAFSWLITFGQLEYAARKLNELRLISEKSCGATF